MTQDQISVGKHLVVPSTGEVVQSYGRIVDRVMPDREEFIESIFKGSGEEPLHLRLARENKITPAMAQSYFGVIPVRASERKDEILVIVGFTPWFSGAFRSRKTDEMERGYYKVLFKIDEYKERKIIVGDEVKRIRQNIIVATSGKRVATFFAQMAETYGLFDWPEGSKVRIVINKDAETNEEEVIPVPEDF